MSKHFDSSDVRFFKILAATGVIAAFVIVSAHIF
jgi:hypothetical protein